MRLFPEAIIIKAARRVLLENRPVIWYIHPREIDPEQPHLPMSRYRTFKTYINLKSTEKKLCRLMDEFDWLTASEYIAGNKNLTE